MAVVGINGFGRIGRMCLRVCLNKGIEVRLINDPHLSTEQMMHSFQHDSTHGPYPVSLKCEKEYIVIGEIRIATSREMKPRKEQWDNKGVKYIIDASGVFADLYIARNLYLTDEKKTPQSKVDGKVVIITTPVKRVTPLIFGVNHTCYNPRIHKIVSAGSSTMNCAAPIIKVMHTNFEILEVMITTIHAMTASQNITDGPPKKIELTTLWRDGRGALQNIIPMVTEDNKSLVEIFPQLKISTISFNIPVPNVSLCDMTFKVRDSATHQQINEAMKEAADNYMKDVLGYTESDCVSSDFNHTTYSCVFDANASIPQIDDFTKIVVWFDNEYGYSCRIADLIQYIHSVKSKYERDFPPK